MDFDDAIAGVLGEDAAVSGGDVASICVDDDVALAFGAMEGGDAVAICGDVAA